MFAVIVVVSLLFGLVGVRLTQLQVVSSDWLAIKGENQRVRTVDLPPGRGAIFDRNGYDLAMSVPQKTIWADPKLVEDPYAAAAQLAPILERDVREVEGLLRKEGRFVYLERKVDDTVSAAVEALDLPGIAMYDEPERFLPEDDMLASVIGQVGIDGEGLSGLERQYKDVLDGKAGSMVVEQDPTGREIPGGMRSAEEPVRGDDLVLTIDRDLQHKVESTLTAQIEEANARGGVAAMMDTKTGELRALANLQVPNGGRGAGAVSAPSNTALTNVYEPGSVSKVLTIGAAMEEGLVGASSSMVVGNRIQVADTVFKEHEDHAVVPWSTTEIVANSSNVGTIMIAEQLGKERLDKYMRDFGFGSPTGLEFPGESPGLMLDTDDYSGTSLPTISIGQGVAVTAMQMLAATNAVANGGIYVEPKLVQGVIDENGEMQASEPGESRRVVSEETAKQMSVMLREVTRVGTATTAQIDGFEVSGKTGTARKPRADGPGYEQGAYVSSFAGFVPTEDPQLTGIVILDQPQPIYGGVVAGPVFADIARFGLQAFGIRPVTVPEGNYGVPFVNEENASSVGEADAPAGITKDEAEQATSTASSTSSTSSTSSSTSPSSTPVPRRESTTESGQG
jgi:cell division protein FtsI (penicillin-binding protein 3)